MGGTTIAILYFFAVYGSARFVRQNHVNGWRALAVAFLSYIVYIVGFFVGMLLLPLDKVPLFSSFILAVSTVVLGKYLLSCDWKPAWIVGGIAGTVHVLAGFLFNGLPSFLFNR